MKSAKFKLSFFGVPDDAIITIALANLEFYKGTNQIPMDCVFDGKFIKIAKRDKFPFEINEAFHVLCTYQGTEYSSKPDTPLIIGAPESYRQVILYPPDSRTVRLILIDKTTGNKISTETITVSYYYDINDHRQFHEFSEPEIIQEKDMDDIFLIVRVPGYKLWYFPKWKIWKEIGEDIQITMEPEYPVAHTIPVPSPGAAPAPGTANHRATSENVLLNFIGHCQWLCLRAKKRHRLLG